MTSQPSQYAKYVDHKLSLAARLGGGDCGGDYSDACILVAALISGIAADLWPGASKDRRRFVETWVRHGIGDANAIRISIPLLARRLRRKERFAEATSVEAMRPAAFGAGNASKILTGEQVDATESEVMQACSTLSLRDIRDRSYPVVFYEHVRSTLVHEYHLDSRSAAVPMTEQTAAVSYVNVITDDGINSKRRIHFHLPWLIELARSIAASAQAQMPSRPLATPTPWWLEG